MTKPTTTAMKTIRIGSMSDRHLLGRDLDLLVVGLGDAVEHLLELARLLARPTIM